MAEAISDSLAQAMAAADGPTALRGSGPVDPNAPNSVFELAPLVLYLSVIVWLLVRTWPLRGDIANRSALLFCSLGLFALGLTWTHMFRFMAQSARDHAAVYAGDRPWTTAQWLRDTSCVWRHPLLG